jgi:hypothetical protein
MELPNSMHLVGTIFGTEYEKEEEEEEEEENDIISESHGNEIKNSEEEKNRKNCKTENSAPFVFDIKEINNNNINNISNNGFISNKIFKNNINFGENNNNKKYNLTSNYILSEIKAEIDKKKKHLVSPPNSSIYNKNDLSNIKNDNSNNNDITNDVNLKNYDANNDSSLNSNQKSSFMNSILNMINQFFDKFRNHPKDDTINSERYKFDNNYINN